MSDTAHELVVFEGPADLAILNAKAPCPCSLPMQKPPSASGNFFAANIPNKNTRRAYYKAACRLSDGCEGRGHTFRATGITAYLKNGGTLEIAQQIAVDESSRTTGLYGRRDDDVSLDEVERIGI